MEKVRNYIYKLLSIKDFTENELRKKVIQKFNNEIDFKELEEIFTYLKDSGYINDIEYTKNYIRIRFNEGYGWNRIEQELKFKKNIKFSFQEEKLKYDWFEKAKEIYQRKYNKDYTDIKEKTKRINYLLRRGFSFEEINYGMEKEN